jgi:tetratricopeptide (TPR) repeat protein
MEEATAQLLRWSESQDVLIRANRVGPLLEELQQFPAAEKVYREIATAPQPGSHITLVSYLARKERTSEALRLAYERASATPPGITARLLSGAIRLAPAELLRGPNRSTRDEETAAARTWVQKQLENLPNDADLHFAKAELASAANDFVTERSTYEQAEKRFPQNPLFLNNLAILLALQTPREPGRALETINRALQILGPQPALLDTRATIHIAANRMAEARSDLNAALASGPRAVYRFHLAQAAETPAQAESHWQEARRNGLTAAMLHPLEWPEYRKRAEKKER